MFIDIHNHIIPYIDDGSDNITTTKAMLQIASDEGIGKIIATPHFIYGDVNNTAEHIIESGVESTNVAREKGIELMFGSEVFICPELCSLVQDGTVCRLNNSRYILIELPMLSVPDYTTDILFNLQLMGYVPILAHPERNKVFQNNRDQLFKFVERGILAQINATSITKLYGKDVQKIAMKFIESGLAHFIASDAHTNRGRAPRMARAYDIITGEFGKELANSLFIENGQAVIDNREIVVKAPVKKKSNFLVSLFNF